MIRTLAFAAAAAALAAPMTAAAQGGSPLTEFQNVCWAASGDYVATLKAADSSGWQSSQLVAEGEDGITVTGKAAREKAGANGAGYTLFVTQGLRHLGSGDVKVTTCKLSVNKPDPTVIAAAKSWIGADPDGGDATLAVYYVGLGGAKPNHVGKAGVNAALAAGGLGILKFQQDNDATILVDQVYSK